MSAPEPWLEASQHPTSHLYPGFKFAGRLPSVHQQRSLQAEILYRLQPMRVLAVGCAFGQELDHILSRIDLEEPQFAVTAIDLAEVEHDLRSCKFAEAMGRRLRWRRLDLLQCNQLEEYGSFDVVQCGFVLHDIAPAEKKAALTSLAQALRPGGLLIVSDFFLSGIGDPSSQALEMYRGIIAEALAAFGEGRLGACELGMLLGDGLGPGLLSTRKEAARGQRDFFETLPGMLARASRCGFESARIVTNPLSRWLAVLVMQKAQF